MFKNPNARVASGKKGKKLMKKLAAIESEDEEVKAPIAKKTQKKLKAAKKPKSEMDITLAKVQALLEAKKQLSTTAAPSVEMNTYVPPQLMTQAPQTNY